MINERFIVTLLKLLDFQKLCIDNIPDGAVWRTIWRVPVNKQPAITLLQHF